MTYWVAAASMLLMSVGNAGTATMVDAVEKAALSDCALVLQKRIHLDNATEMAAHGYTVEPVDEEGLWASRTVEGSQLRIGSEPGKPGCRVRFAGPDAERVYEAVVQRLIGRGFAFPGGKRKRAEPQFVLDTLVQEKGVVAIVSMFRVNAPDATIFAMTLFPPPSN